MISKWSCHVIVVNRRGRSVIRNKFLDYCGEITIKGICNLKLVTYRLTINFKRLEWWVISVLAWKNLFDSFQETFRVIHILLKQFLVVAALLKFNFVKHGITKPPIGTPVQFIVCLARFFQKIISLAHQGFDFTWYPRAHPTTHLSGDKRGVFITQISKYVFPS